MLLLQWQPSIELMLEMDCNRMKAFVRNKPLHSSGWAGGFNTQHTIVFATLHNSQTADYIATLVTLDGPNEDFVHNTKSAKMDHPLSPAYGLALHPPLTPHVSGRV